MLLKISPDCYKTTLRAFGARVPSSSEEAIVVGDLSVEIDYKFNTKKKNSQNNWP